MKYTNPVISGFHPDPSICRVGEDYYVVTSSFEYFSCIPVFHSKDLVNWTQLGHCMTRRSQGDLSSGWPNGLGIYAPTIRYHEGRFYVITTNVAGGGNCIFWTDDPAGEWSEPVWLDLPGIDPSLYFEDGRAYYTGTADHSIYLCEVDVHTGEVLSERRNIWAGTGGADPEGPHIYKIGEYYYLLISEGGTSQGHMITVARSEEMAGPYESCPRNPVMTNRSLPLPIKATGHADFVQAHDGTWWAICLAIRPVPYPERHHLGRETFLVPVQWDAEGWPVMGHGGTVLSEMDAPSFAESVPGLPGLKRDDFDGETLGLDWNFIFNPDDELWSLSDKPGSLTLKGSGHGLDDKETSAWLGRRQEHMTCTARTLLSFRPGKDKEEAGLSVFLNGDHHYEISLTMEEGQRCLAFRRRIGSLWKVENRVPYDKDFVVLELQATPTQYTFLFGEEGGAMTEIGSGEVHYLSTEVGGKFTGNYIVLYATGNGEPCTAPAHFDWFEYLPIEL